MGILLLLVFSGTLLAFTGISVGSYNLPPGYYLDSVTGNITSPQPHGPIVFIDMDSMVFNAEPSSEKSKEKDKLYKLCNKQKHCLTVERGYVVMRRSPTSWHIEKIGSVAEDVYRFRTEEEECISLSRVKGGGFRAESPQTLERKLKLEKCDKDNRDQWFNLKVVNDLESSLGFKEEVGKSNAAPAKRGSSKQEKEEGTLKDFEKLRKPESADRQMQSLDKRVLRLENIIVALLDGL
jgi:hypothetical protein